MLTSDLVEVRRRGDVLALVAFEGDRRALAEELARKLHGVAHSYVGESREDVEAALQAIEAPARARKLVLGLRKVLEDASEWDRAATLEPEPVRKAVFERAAAMRSSLADDARFDREIVLAEIAAQMSATVEEVEASLFADLRAAEVLKSVELPTPNALIERYAAEQVQAVLLRAVSVRVTLRCDGPHAYRALFHKLKFLRLMFTLSHGEDGAYELRIDGPYSLFESVTKYGFQLAMFVPYLDLAREYELVADVRWGPADARKDLRFTHRGGGTSSFTERPLSDDAQSLFDDLAAHEGPWRPRVSDAILDLKGAGLCVPDLELEHGKTGEIVYVEVLGFWSRDAVFRRKQLVEAGLPHRIVFVASTHLRVREELLADDSTGALYVYKKVPSAKILLERVSELAERKVRR